MSEEKSDSDSPSSLPIPPFVGPSGARSHFVGLPIHDKFNALNYYCAVIYGQVKSEERSFAKNEAMKQSADTCMVCLNALASLLEDCGISGFSDTAELE